MDFSRKDTKDTNDKKDTYGLALKLQGIRPAHSDDKDLAVTDPPGAGAFDNAIGRFFRLVVIYPDVDFHFGQEGHAVFAADIAVQIAFLPAIALGFLSDAGDHVEVGDGPQDRLGPKGFDDNRDLFHVPVRGHSTGCGKSIRYC